MILSTPALSASAISGDVRSASLWDLSFIRSLSPSRQRPKRMSGARLLSLNRN
jgi:hypothetical protein